MKFRTLTCTTAMTLFVALSLAGNARAQTFTLLHSFDETDGANPEAGLVQATNGDLYGTTVINNGTVFAITPSGTLTTVHSFDMTDGAEPYAGLVLATNGNFYGTTYAGGAHEAGTIFKITPSGTLTTLYSFCPQSGCTDGENPYSVLAQSTNGNLYGTTIGGGNDTCNGGYGCGTVFEVSPSGTLTTLHAFDGKEDGSAPVGALVLATDGSFYGTTTGGGAKAHGTVFKITPKGALTTLYSFCSQTGCTDGLYPYAGLIQATDGNLYGTTEGGGANGSGGTIFKITPAGTLTTVYSFCSQSGCTDGQYPAAALIQATDGNFYGTTLEGGSGDVCTMKVGCGTVFSITPSGTLTTLYSFCSQSGCTNGEEPRAALVQDTDGTFYGTTAGGTQELYGTVFSLSVGLGPFVETLPPAGKVGASVKILGTDLTGATSVTFNGTPATFVVGSANGIATTVPAGATTGTVKVTTPTRTLSSNVVFRVTP